MIWGLERLVGGYLTRSSRREMKLPEVEYPRTVPSLAWVYILQSADDCFYVGYSRDVGERLRKHRYGIGSKHTRDHRGARLVFVEGPLPKPVAVSREAQLKRWSRAKKEALIRGDLESLHRLSRSRD